MTGWAHHPTRAVMAETTRLLLRVLCSDDAAALNVTPEWVHGKIAQQRQLGYSPWAVEDLHTGQVHGFCGLFYREHKGITLGYAINVDARGRGYATEAAAAVLDWAEQRRIPVYASIRPPNPASVRVLEKVGMRPREHYWDEDGERLIFTRVQTPS